MRTFAWLNHKSTAGILKPIPEAVDLVGNPPPGLITNTVVPLQQRVSANQWCAFFAEGPPARLRCKSLLYFMTRAKAAGVELLGSRTSAGTWSSICTIVSLFQVTC